MEIRYFGRNKIYLQGKKEGVWINPEKSDLEQKQRPARIVIFTKKEANFIALGEEGERVIITGAGEYEIGGVEINGINGMYSLVIDKVKVLLTGRQEGELSEKKKEKLEEADVLLVCINEKAIELAKGTAANYIIPVDFEENETEFHKFMDEFDKEDLAAIDSLKVDSDNLPEGKEVVLLKSQA